MIDLTGQHFGKWTVQKFVQRTESVNMWECCCACGTVRVVREFALVSQRSTQCKSCGRRKGKHAHPIEYRIWQGMKNRCNNPNSQDYALYGQRGIYVDKEWANFDAFYADMGSRPPNHSIDRINNDGPYSKDNCRWANAVTQASNKRIQKSNKTGIAGVNHQKSGNGYTVRTTVNGKRTYIGFFKTLQNAIEAKNNFEHRAPPL